MYICCSNNKFFWFNINDALAREDVAELTKTLIRCAANNDKGLEQLAYEGNPKNGKGYLYGKYV